MRNCNRPIRKGNIHCIRCRNSNNTDPSFSRKNDGLQLCSRQVSMLQPRPVSPPQQDTRCDGMPNILLLRWLRLSRHKYMHGSRGIVRRPWRVQVAQLAPLGPRDPCVSPPVSRNGHNRGGEPQLRHPTWRPDQQRLLHSSSSRENFFTTDGLVSLGQAQSQH